MIIVIAKDNKMKKKSVNRNITVILLCLCVLVECIFLCEYSHVHLWEVYLPTGWTSDEVSYYKLIESVIKYGYPRGYWGYYESRASIGSFGPWFPCRMAVYICLGKIFGWNFYSPLLFNNAFMIIALMIFYFLSKKSLRETAFVCGIIVSVPWIARYSISMMTEPFTVALEIILTALVYHIFRGENGKYLIWTYIIIFLLFLQRPYFVLLFLLPLLFIKREFLRKRLPVTIICMLGLSFAYTKLTSALCADYIPPDRYGIDVKTDLAQKLSGNINTLVNIILGHNMTYGFGYLLFLVVLVFILVKLFTDISANRGKKRILVDLYLLTFHICILASILIQIEPYQGSRHIIFSSVLCELLLLIFSDDNKFVYGMIGANVLVFLICLKDSSLFFQIPARDKAADKVVWEKQIYDKDIQMATNDISWDNTLMIDATNVDYNYVYYLPAWMGIQLSWDNFYTEENVAAMHTKYIMTSENSKAAKICRENEWTVFLDSRENDVCIFEKP